MKASGGNNKHRMDPERSALELIPRLYDAALNTERIEGALNAVERTLGGYFAGLALRVPGGDRPPAVFGSEGSGALGEAYEASGHVVDPFTSHLRSAPLDVGEVAPSAAPLPRATMLRTVFYNDYMRPNGLAWGPNYAIVLARENGCPSASSIVARISGAGPLDEVGERLVSLLAPHLVEVHRVWSWQEEAKEREARLADALDRMPMAVLLVDARRRVLWASRAAREILSARDGLRVHRGALGAHASRASRVLEQRVGGAVRTGTGQGVDAGGALLVPRPSGRRALEVRVTPMPRETALGALEMPAAAAVFVTDPEARPPQAEEVLAALYALTPAESALATLLCADLPLSQAADRLGVTVETARQRLKTVFDKTGVRRQSSLVRLLLRGPASLRTRDSRCPADGG